MQRALYESGIRQMSHPIRATRGRLSVTVEGEIFVLYDFIDGDWTNDYPFDAYVDLIAQIHRADLHVAADHETFDDPSLSLERELAEILGGTCADPSQRDFQRALASMRLELESDIALFRRVIGEARAINDVQLVITHHDAPGNILKDASGGIFLIDWDDVMLAPRERDTWFHVTKPEDTDRFLDLYRRTFPGYVVDRRLYAFYLLGRYFEDISGMLARILAPTTTPEAKAEHLGYFHADLAQHRPAVRAL